MALSLGAAASMVGWMIVWLVLAPMTLLVVWTLVLTTITWIRQLGNHHDASKSCLCSGRVQHTRLHPVVHSFSYPIFFAAIYLDQVQDLFGAPKHSLWPLSTVMSFRTNDHLKNGEGITENNNKSQSLQDRVFYLVSERTRGKFQPNPTTHVVVLLTHLRYYGYCFNPISFYFVCKHKDQKVDCIVGEVSNTPWNEMQCYVLHPSSVDVMSMQSQQGIHVVFPKTFHVSPFMEMNYWYEWTLDEYLLGKSSFKQIKVHTLMKRVDESNDKICFTASFEITPVAFLSNPFKCAWTLVRFPMYCALVQIWIHYEALWLFVKGVVFIPHPNGSETAASKVIEKVMTPIFAFKDWIQQRQGSSSGVQDEKQKSS